MRSHSLRLIPMLLLVAACGGDSGGGGPSEIVEMIKWTPSGDNQTDTSGQTLPLVIRVKVTVNEDPSAGHTVHFSGPGSFGTPDVTTGANGIATTTWTLPTEAGPVQATATLDGAVGSPITFNATGIVGTAVAMNKIMGDGQSTVRNTVFNTPFQIQVVDQYGNGKAGVMVNWGITGPGHLAATSSPTDDFGFGNGLVTADDALGDVTVTATVAGLTGSPQTFTGSVISATSIVQVQNNVFAPSTLTIQAGGAVTWILIGSGHTVTSTGGGVIGNSPVLTTGENWGPVVFNTPGVYTYECSEHVGMTGSITVNP